MADSASKQQLAVAALGRGTVIDHIPSNVLFKVAALLGVEQMDCPITIGNNLPSRRLGRKGIIKVADRFFDDDTLNRIAVIAPGARVNIIRDFQVVEKRRVTLEDTIIGIVRCDNPKCITNNEPMLTRFETVDRERGVIACCYCGREYDHTNVRLNP